MFKWALWHEKGDAVKDILSPNGRIKCVFELKNSQISYHVYRDEKLIIKPSRLGFMICGEEPLTNGLKLVRSQTKKHEEIIEMPWGEDRYINNNYNEMAFYLAENKEEKRIFTIRFRVFDDGVAFRYEIPPQPKFQRITIKDELTEFNVDQNSIAWQIPAYQPDRYEYNYEKCSVFEITGSVHTPLTMHTPTGYYLSIHEAALYNYGSMTIRINSSNVLQSDITPLSDGTKAHLLLPFL